MKVIEGRKVNKPSKVTSIIGIFTMSSLDFISKSINYSKQAIIIVM